MIAEQICTVRRALHTNLNPPPTGLIPAACRLPSYAFSRFAIQCMGSEDEQVGKHAYDGRLHRSRSEEAVTTPSTGPDEDEKNAA